MASITWRVTVCRAGLAALRCFTSQRLQHSRVRWQVSSYGRICNTRGVISNGYLRADGYYTANICGQTWRTHRGVKITFHGLPKLKQAWQVHHVDGDPTNNRLDNLEYVTPSENIRHTYSNHSRRSSWPAKSKPVLWRPVGSTSWTTSPSITLAALQLGFGKNTVSRCCRDQIATKGYEFKYQELSERALPAEEWRPMVDPTSGVLVPGRMVSSFGRTTSQTGLISRGYLTAQGYYRILIMAQVDSRYQSVYVHRLVAFAFLGPPPSDERIFVNHKDLDKGNNAVDNLEWVSAVENRAHFLATSTIRLGTKPVWSRPRGMDKSWKWHHSMASAARELRLCKSSIWKCIQGLMWQASGFEFRLADMPKTVVPSLPGEEWRDIDLVLLQRDRKLRGLC